MGRTRARLVLFAAIIAAVLVPGVRDGSQDPPPAQAKPAETRAQVWPASAHEGPASGNVIYLTFDDGPHRVWTPRILDLLDKYDAKATFFQLGRQTAAEPALAAEVRRRGHAVGNHTVNHVRLTSLSAPKLRAEISGGPASACLRPPFGLTNARVHRTAASLGLREVLWTVDTWDWRKPGTAKIVRALLTGAGPGVIVLLHDGGGNRAQTVRALEIALPRLVARGYQFRALPC
jgi:peptidoglycan/xylan/chitin deacetylase (PgdA/CDA1 family)